MDTEGKANDGASLPSIARTKHRAMWRQSGPYKRLVTERTRKGSSGHESQRRHARQDTQRRKWTHSCQGKRDVREDTQKKDGIFFSFLLFLIIPLSSYSSLLHSSLSSSFFFLLLLLFSFFFSFFIFCFVFLSSFTSSSLFYSSSSFLLLVFPLSL